MLINLEMALIKYKGKRNNLSMQKIVGFLSIFLITGIVFTTSNVSAHNPMHLDFDYDTDTDTLRVTIIHGERYKSSSMRTKIKGMLGDPILFTYYFLFIMAPLRCFCMGCNRNHQKIT